MLHLGSERLYFDLHLTAARLVSTLILLAAIAACATAHDNVGIYISRVPARDGGNVNRDLVVGMWGRGQLDMSYSEIAVSVGQDEYTLPITIEDLHAVIGWVQRTTMLSCSDGTTFEHFNQRGRWRLFSINVYPREGDLTVTTYQSAPGPAKTFYFDEIDGDFACTRAEDGTILVTS